MPTHLVCACTPREPLVEVYPVGEGEWKMGVCRRCGEKPTRVGTGRLRINAVIMPKPPEPN